MFLKVGGKDGTIWVEKSGGRLKVWVDDRSPGGKWEFTGKDADAIIAAANSVDAAAEAVRRLGSGGGGGLGGGGGAGGSGGRNSGTGPNGGRSSGGGAAGSRGGQGDQLVKALKTAWDKLTAKQKAASPKHAAELSVGRYTDLAKQSVKNGRTPDHIPSFAAIRAYKVRVVYRRTLTDQEETALRAQTNCILILTATHQKHSRTYGQNLQQAEADSWNLRKAFNEDKRTLRPYLMQDGNTAQEVDDAFDKLDQLNRNDKIY